MEAELQKKDLLLKSISDRINPGSGGKAATPNRLQSRMRSAAEDVSASQMSSGKKRRRAEKLQKKARPFADDASEDEGWKPTQARPQPAARSMRPPNSRAPGSRRAGRLSSMSAASMSAASDQYETDVPPVKPRGRGLPCPTHEAASYASSARLQHCAPAMPPPPSVKAHDIFGQEMDPYAESDGFALDDL